MYTQVHQYTYRRMPNITDVGNIIKQRRLRLEVYCIMYTDELAHNLMYVSQHGYVGNYGIRNRERQPKTVIVILKYDCDCEEEEEEED